MRKTSKAPGPTGNFADPFFAKLVSVMKVIRIEFLITLMALILSLGQYFQNSINVRINITSTWREGYKSETRTRVNRFIYYWKKWKSEWCAQNGETCEARINETILILASADKLYGEGQSKPQLVCNEFFDDLIRDEVETIRRERQGKIGANTSPAPGEEKTGVSTCPLPGEVITDDDYRNIILNYKNSIIECLNTMEAVKAVIQSKPLPFKITIFYKDTLEGRYRDIIEELKVGLMDFIVAYRETHSDRATEAWYVLTSDESYLNDLANVVLYILVFSSALTIVYLIKIQMLKHGRLREGAS